MKVVGIIPARYASTRLPGKPLKDILGYPMIWWVYKRVRSVKQLDEIYVATDDDRIKNICDKYEIPVIMTSPDHPNGAMRLQEVSESVRADFYVQLNGDEPLISEECILPVVPTEQRTEPYFGGAMRILTDPAETIDFAKIKVVVSDTGRCLYMSRTPVP